MQASPQDRLWPTLSPPALALHLSVQTQRQALPLHLEKICVPLRPRLFSFAFYRELCHSSRHRAPMTRTTEPLFAAQRRSGTKLPPALTSPSPFKHAEIKHPSGSFPKGWVGRGAFCCSQLPIYFHGSPSPLFPSQETGRCSLFPGAEPRSRVARAQPTPNPRISHTETTRNPHVTDAPSWPASSRCLPTWPVAGVRGAGTGAEAGGGAVPSGGRWRWRVPPAVGRPGRGGRARKGGAVQSWAQSGRLRAARRRPAAHGLLCPWGSRAEHSGPQPPAVGTCARAVSTVRVSPRRGLSPPFPGDSRTRAGEIGSAESVVEPAAGSRCPAPAAGRPLREGSPESERAGEAGLGRWMYGQTDRGSRRGSSPCAVCSWLRWDSLRPVLAWSGWDGWRRRWVECCILVREWWVTQRHG